ncbi:arsenical pump-driving ATPase [Pelagicoccus sp. SDUM812003]|uniref:arsenical pump-driving ATPase n=1 Tax=Pelagicoccus sp. SDUM812003 TaxID=3041267 RepID=UPI0028102E02|nr:arsenical pump-driving ATPase [Pelagicoccus sp. SDUM812003]MDQ8204122.1 arsenical pump-driving ATPase [Pelagicoccus sp. SDUM812003]
MIDARPLAALAETATRFLFFTGKGGVGKTSLSCATAVALADAGKRVLLVSTDPASNLDEILGETLTETPRSISEAPNLWAMNIDPEAAAQAYRERIVGPIRGVLPDATVRNIEEQLSGACTTEIASFNEFSRLLGDETTAASFEYVILDTAPTGHTLRLLALPEAWTDFIASNKTGSSCLGPLSGLSEQRPIYEKALAALKDASQTTLVLVARADEPSLREADRASSELRALGIENQSLILNALFEAVDREDALARAMEEQGKAALLGMPRGLATLPKFGSRLRGSGLAGIAALRAMYSDSHGAIETVESMEATDYPRFERLVEDLASAGRGVVMTMGKGGVGKTTLAKRLALRLAELGHRTHLTTTDPANHVGDTEVEDSGLLSVSAIEPKETTRRHVEEVLATAGKDLDPDAYALLEEELRSPCTEEIAVFTAFAREVAKGEEQFVILDTAPTGHTLLLLDATEAYHREVLRNASALPEPVQRLLPRLRDPDFTKVIVVALPEATPVHEAAHLQSDLRRAEIEPYAWVLNQCLSGVETGDPLLRLRARNELQYIEEVATQHAKRWSVEPWRAELKAALSRK